MGLRVDLSAANKWGVALPAAYLVVDGGATYPSETAARLRTRVYASKAAYDAGKPEMPGIVLPNDGVVEIAIDPAATTLQAAVAAAYAKIVATWPGFAEAVSL